jgi:RNA exonuclease 4
MEDAFVREMVLAALAREELLAGHALESTTAPPPVTQVKPSACVIESRERLAREIERTPGITKNKLKKRNIRFAVPPTGNSTSATTQQCAKECRAEPSAEAVVPGPGGVNEPNVSSLPNSLSGGLSDAHPVVVHPQKKHFGKLSSNWQALRKALHAENPQRSKVNRRVRIPAKLPSSENKSSSVPPAGEIVMEAPPPKCSMFVRGALRGGPAKPTKIVALDCEFVGVGEGGREDVLARASLVNSRGEVLFDAFVRVDRPVVNYRTEVSGVRPEDLTAPDAADPKAARAEIADILKGRILVGHAVGNDLRVLRITHPRKDTRDTADYYKRLWRKNGRRGGAPPALRQVVAKVLGVDQFQTLEHDSCEDARAALALYKKSSKEWEASRRKS